MARRRIRAGFYMTNPGPPTVDLNAENFYVDQPRQAKPYLKVSLFGTKKRPAAEGQQRSGRGPSWDGMVAKAGNQVDKAHRKLLEASGTRYEVMVRGSSRMKSAGKTSSPAQAQRRAIAKGGIVHDHYEGRVIFVSPSYHQRYGPKDSPPETSNGDQDTDGTWEVSA